MQPCAGRGSKLGPRCAKVGHWDCRREHRVHSPRWSWWKQSVHQHVRCFRCVFVLSLPRLRCTTTIPTPHFLSSPPTPTHPFISPGDPEMWPQLSTHRCWGQCTDDCLQLAKKGRGPRKCDHRSTLHFTIRQHPEGSVQLVSATRQSQEMCVTAVGPRVVEPSASRVNAQAYRTELHQCTTPHLKTQRWYISDTGAISARLQQGTMCITAPTKRSVVPYDDRLLRADCAFLPA